MQPRHHRSWALGLLAIALGSADPAGAVSGDLDLGFGIDGRTEVAFPGPAFARALVALPDGRVVVGGTVEHEDTGNLAYALARLDESGALDLDFGNAGKTFTQFPDAGGNLSSIVVLGDGRLLGGGSVNSRITGQFDAVVVRYLADGSPDPSLGVFASTPGFFADMIVNDVSVVTLVNLPTAAGRFRAFHVFDAFDSHTIHQPTELRPRAMALQSDGRVVVVEVGAQMVVTRIDLRNDPSFGPEDPITMPADVALDEVRKLGLQTDGRIVIAGRVGQIGADTHLGVMRLLPDGTPDTSFGNGGRVLLPLGTTFDEVLDVAPLADGRLVIGGKTCDASCTGFLARLREDGGLDLSFGREGFVRDLLPVDAILLPDQDHLLVAASEGETMVVTRHLLSTCGNDVLEAGETCDDGNTDDGDCCAADCRVEPDGSPCATDDSACTADVCRAGSCTHALPEDAGCAIAESAALALVDDADDTLDRVRLRWSSVTVPASPLGDPTTATDVSLCVIDGPPEARRLIAELTAPAGVSCGTSPCWRRTQKGFRYRDRTRTRDGIGTLALVVDGAAARVLLKAKGAGTDLRTLATADRLLVRVVQSDAPGCFESTVVTTGAGSARLRATTR